MSIFDNINGLTADRILQVVKLEKARDGRSWICPECGNGSGKTGDGIKATTYHGRQIWHCYRCDMHATNADMIKSVEKITDEAELARRLEELFPEYVEKPFFFEGQSKREASKAPAATNLSDEHEKSTPKNFEASGFYSRCRGRLAKFLEERGGKYRGLTLQTLVEACAGYADNFMDNKFLVLPYGKDAFFAREVDGHRKYFTKDAARRMYVASPIKAGEVGRLKIHAKNFVVEGEIDALTIKQALGKCISQYGVVGTGGAGRIRAFFDSVDKQFADADIKPQFLFAADNDQRGLEAAKEFCEMARAKGYPAESFAFADDAGKYEDVDGNLIREVAKVDANSYLTEHGDAALFEFLLDVAERKEDSLDRQAAKFKSANTAPDAQDEKISVTPDTDSESPDGKIKIDFDFETERPDSLPANSTTLWNLKPSPSSTIEATSSLKENFNVTSTIPPTEIKNAVAEKLGVASYELQDYFANHFYSDVGKLAKYSDLLSGFELLDMKQAWLPGLYVVGGAPGTGKTSFCWQLLNQFAERGERCIYCSYEMAPLELFTKSLTRELRLQKLMGDSVQTPSSSEIRLGSWRLADVKRAVEKVMKTTSRLKVFDLGAKLVKLDVLIKILEEEVHATPDKPPIIALDYLQLIPVENSKASAKERLDEIMLRLKTFQSKTSTMIFLISSLNRTGYNKISGGATVDDLTTFKESGMIEFSSDVIWKLTTVDGTKGDEFRNIILTCAKNRHGAPFRVGFEYYPQSDYFRSCELKKTAAQEVKMKVLKTVENSKREDSKHAR